MHCSFYSVLLCSINNDLYKAPLYKYKSERCFRTCLFDFSYSAEMKICDILKLQKMACDWKSAEKHIIITLQSLRENWLKSVDACITVVIYFNQK